MPSVMTDIMTLIQHEIPEGRQNIHDSHTNLEKVAEYCEANYFQADNKHAALEETKRYATQSLASVAYQINTLAYNLLHLLDLQTAQLAEMESQVHHLSQTVMIHKEKVARREIGVLTANKSATRQHKILAPASQERPVKYIRRPIDYSVLDDVGHGLRSMANNGANRTRRVPSSQSLINAGPAPTTKPPTPPQANRGVTVGSLTRGAREYRTPAPPIAPPQVPSNYAANYPLGHPRRGSGYSTLPAHGHHSSGQHPAPQRTPPPSLSSQPQVGMVHPMSQQHVPQPQPQSLPHHIPQATQQLTDPPVMSSSVTDRLPEPPPPHMVPPVDYDHQGNVSPPLPPPPPPVAENLYSGSYVPPSPPAYGRQHLDGEHDWVPKNYIEKVVAIYDYTADKDDELSFSESSLIYVVKKNDDGWYEGVMNGVTGLFPGNYVEPLM
ncbi:abl interactor 2-like isoform X2 [Ornithodoros turicata]|uniref:abl interactor 2-like isoform X2 n=1 Tax=Ornithodoros turicata TaxID=34597 RepID=UPI0031391658